MKKILTLLFLSLLGTSVFPAFTARAMDERPAEDGTTMSVRIPKWERFVRITGSNVNLRMEPGMDGEKLKGEFFAKGEVAPLLDESDEWVKLYYLYSPTGYVWLFRQYAEEVTPEPLPSEFRFSTSQTYGYKMLTYVFNGKPTNICYSADYPFETEEIETKEPDVFKGDGRFPRLNEWQVDWATVMPEIIRTIPDKCIHKVFRGEPFYNGEKHNFRTEYGDEDWGCNFYFSFMPGDALFMLTISALPTKDADVIQLIAHSQSGIDGLGTDLLTCIRYNMKTRQYSDFRTTLPGVVTDKLGLSFDILADQPKYQKIARQSTYRDMEIHHFCWTPMVSVTINNLEYEYPISVYDIDGYIEQSHVYYLWDGETFVKLARSPYSDLLEMNVKEYYEKHAAALRNASSDKTSSSKTSSGKASDGHEDFMEFFREAIEKADSLAAANDRVWMDFDPWTFLSNREPLFSVGDVKSISASHSSFDHAEVTICRDEAAVSPGYSNQHRVTVNAMLDDDQGRYLIYDIKFDDISILDRARDFIKEFEE